MANKQTRRLAKLGMCTTNNGASTVEKKIVHGSYPFLAPDAAKARKRKKA